MPDLIALTDATYRRFLAAVQRIENLERLLPFQRRQAKVRPAQASASASFLARIIGGPGASGSGSGAVGPIQRTLLSTHPFHDATTTRETIPSISVPSGQTLVVLVAAEQASVTAVGYNGESLTRAGSEVSSVSGMKSSIWYGKIAGTNATLEADFDAHPANAAIIVLGVSGINGLIGANGATDNSDSPASGNVTLPAGPCILIGWTSFYDVLTTDHLGTWQAGFTDGARCGTSFGPQPDLNASEGYLIIDDGAAHQAAKTGTTAREWNCLVAAFAGVPSDSGSGSGSGVTPDSNAYSWIQEESKANGLKQRANPFLYGTPTHRPAFEDSLNPNVPIGAMVRLFPGYVDPAKGQTYDFSYCCGNAPIQPGSGKESGTGGGGAINGGGGGGSSGGCCFAEGETPPDMVASIVFSDCGDWSTPHGFAMPYVGGGLGFQWDSQTDDPTTIASYDWQLRCSGGTWTMTKVDIGLVLTASSVDCTGPTLVFTGPWTGGLCTGSGHTVTVTVTPA